MTGKVKSECSSQTMISVPPFLTKRNLLQTNIFRNRVSDPSYFATKSSLENAAKTPKRCPPDVSIATTVSGKTSGNSRKSCVIPNGDNKTTTVSSVEGRKKKIKSKFDKTQDSSEQTLWGWTEGTKAGSKGGASSNLGNVKVGGESGTRNDGVRNSVNLNGAGERRKQPDEVLQSQDKIVATDDNSIFVECEPIVTSAENDFRDDCPVNYSFLNATIEKQGIDYLQTQSQQTTVGDAGSHTSGDMQRICAGITHDASSPFNTSVVFCKSGLKPDSAIPRDDSLTKIKVGSSRKVNPSTSTSTYMHVPPIDAFKKLDGSLGGNSSSTTTQSSKSRHLKRKQPPASLDNSFLSDKAWKQIVPNDTQKLKSVSKEGKRQEEVNQSHGHTARFTHKHDTLSQKTQNLKQFKTESQGIVPQVKSRHRDDAGNTTIGQKPLDPFNFYDVLDCKSKDVEELFNIQKSFETASSEASQVSFRSVTEGNYCRSRQDRRCLHSEPMGCGSKDSPYISGISSPASSHRNSSLKFDPDVFKSTFSISFEKDSPLLNSMQHLRADESKYLRDRSKVSLNSSLGKMGLRRDSGKFIDMCMPSKDQFRTPSYETTKANDEYLLQVSSPKDVLMMSLQTFKGLSITDPRSRLDCEKFLGHKSTGEKLNNFIRSRAIFNSVSLMQSQSFTQEQLTDGVKISEKNLGFGLGASTKNEGIVSAESSGQSILQCIYKSQNF